MKRTALIAVLIVAMAVAAAGFAVAADETVTVTARVNPAFSMTINQNAVDFVAVAIGSTHTDATTAIQVKSNKLWDFSKTPTVPADLIPLLSDTTSVTPGIGLSRGVTNITATYTLDLTTDDAYELEADTDYTATYLYTATQQ